MKPYIGITCATFRDKDWCPPTFGHRQSYVDAVIAAGGIPFLIPLIEEEHVLRAIYERMDGLLLAGGGDVMPHYYGEEPHERLGTMDPLRDFVEIPLIRWASSDGMPVLGICRGVQVMNVALGGTLYQDIDAQLETSVSHESSYERKDWLYMAHELRLDPDSRLADLLGAPNLHTNSLHHQAIKDIAPGLRVVGWSPDGVVEAVEGTNGHFLMGVQCHPEALLEEGDPRWRAMFTAFVESCKDFQQQLAHDSISS